MNKWKHEINQKKNPEPLKKKAARYALYGGSVVGAVTAIVMFPISTFVIAGLVAAGWGVKKIREKASESERKHILPVYGSEVWDADEETFETIVEDL